MLTSPQAIPPSKYFQAAAPPPFQMLESRETAEQVLLSSLRKLDKGKRSRTGLELKRGLLIAFTLFKARQILWQYPTPLPPSQMPPTQLPFASHASQEEIYLASEEYSPLSGDPSMLSTLEGVGKDFNSDIWQPSNNVTADIGDEEEEGEEEDDSDSDDIDIDEEDPFDDFGSHEPIFPPPFPLIFPEEQIPVSSPSVVHTSSGLTNLTTVVPGSEAHRNFDQNHPTASTHLSNPLVAPSNASRKRPSTGLDYPENIHISPLKRLTPTPF
ncbi:zinc finger protein [Echinococcus multilocularis]|uniref:Zinc finger protein n=1 Tax=Echinococcus multilocularis TaxID=6211 RepID=A0A068Y0E6_ECHMU|nr:zinc finger protein [Echinococcus multilocularis]